MLLTRADVAGGEPTTILGPPGTTGILRSFRFFYSRPDTKVECFEVLSTKVPTISGKPFFALFPIFVLRAKKHKKLTSSMVVTYRVSIHMLQPPRL